MTEDKVSVGSLNEIALEHPVALAVVVQKGLQGGDADIFVHGTHRVGHQGVAVPRGHGLRRDSAQTGAVR